MFGEERLQAVFTNNRQPENLFNDIIESVQQFVGSNEKDDDLSLLEIRMDEPARVNSFAQEASDKFGNSEIEWAMGFEVKPTSFKVFDPLPMLLNVLMEVPSLRAFSSTLYTILAELYTNALDHGVLKLDSSLKSTAEGFADYYRLREERINTVADGFVRIHITHKTNENGGLLKVRIEDSGEGFDYRERAVNTLSTFGYSGRGIALVEKLCGRVTYLGSGNIVEVDFSWVSDD
jgi:hypothetical protein